jgi:hypothetical protein
MSLIVHQQLDIHLIQPTISLEMPVPSQGHYGFHSFPVVDWFCLFVYLWVLVNNNTWTKMDSSPWQFILKNKVKKKQAFPMSW